MSRAVRTGSRPDFSCAASNPSRWLSTLSRPSDSRSTQGREPESPTSPRCSRPGRTCMASRKNSGSPSTTSEPPLASSWAAPPEFYLDENLAGRTLAQALRGLGYVVHTPFELYKGRHKAEGTPDEVWLRDVGQH